MGLSHYWDNIVFILSKLRKIKSRYVVCVKQAYFCSHTLNNLNNTDYVLLAVSITRVLMEFGIWIAFLLRARGLFCVFSRLKDYGYVPSLACGDRQKDCQ